MVANGPGAHTSGTIATAISAGLSWALLPAAPPAQPLEPVELTLDFCSGRALGLVPIGAGQLQGKPQSSPSALLHTSAHAHEVCFSCLRTFVTP